MDEDQVSWKRLSMEREKNNWMICQFEKLSW